MKSSKKAIITGISGQDGYFLSRLLLQANYEVVGTTRKINPSRIELYSGVKILEFDYSKKSINELVAGYRPDLIFHLAGQTYVGKSWSIISETINASALIAVDFLEAIAKQQRFIKFFNSSSSEIFADTSDLLTEFSMREPTTPYGCAKLLSHSMTSAFRANYNLYAVNGILFNHESSLRQNDFFSMKLIKGVVDIYEKNISILPLGNLDIVRDWGAAEEYMKSVFEIMHLDKSEDYNICSSHGTSVRQIVEYAFSLLDMDYRDYTIVDNSLVRNKEKKRVIGSNEKLKNVLGWTPMKKIEDVIRDMLEVELKRRGLK